MLYLVLILMLMIGVSEETCPNMCECRYYPRSDMPKTSFYYTSISCNTYDENITSQLDNTTSQFRIANVNKMDILSLFADLKNHSGLPFLEQLTITKSEFVNLNKSVQGLDWISSLTLIDNELTVIPQSFLNLSALQSLDLSRNALKRIEQEPFRTLKALETLNLSANSLNNINKSGFLGLNNLKYLDLSKNNLTSLSEDVLSVLPTLQHLNLSNNGLEILHEACFARLILLQQLDVSWNRLSRVAPGSLELPSLTRLLLTGNTQLGESRDAAVLVGSGRKLQTVDASRTGLKQVPATLTHSIRTVRLAGNLIRSVNCGDLDSYPLLQLLDLTSNKLVTMEEDALGRLDSLAVLYLTDNNMHEIPKSLPEKLKALHVERNDVGKVSEKDLQGLAALEVLLLSDNKISIIDEGAFSQLVSLVTLDLSRNPVIILQPGSLTGPFALQVLRLSSMRIMSPAEENTFPLSTPDNLITLDLSDSPGLARQFLADTATIVASKQLQELDLSGTNLEYIRSDLLHFLPQLRSLHIKGNRLNCSQLHWLGTWLRRQDAHEYRDVVCSSPPEMWGVSLVDIQDDEVSTTDTRQAYITGKISSTTNALIDVNYTRVPLKKSVLDKNENESSKNKSHSIQHNQISVNLDSKRTLTVPFQTVKYLWQDENILNETGKAAITETSTRLKQTPKLTAQNANETAESQSNRPSPASGGGFISKFSRDLFITLQEKSFNNSVDTEEELKKSGVGENSIDVPPQWNGKMSMYTNNKQNDGFLHPGMLIFAAGVAFAAAAVAILVVRFIRNRRACREDDIEVASLPTITDLW
ncbi:hypothetical protein JTB14_016583 [Gonioctena quinquepunctata]|nr:hypothetical protein JTB14_016583 [Gonioctena quinquepunctata]